jgi:hypothetical protein
MSALSSIGDCDDSEDIFGRRGEGDDDDDDVTGTVVAPDCETVEDDAKATKSLALTENKNNEELEGNNTKAIVIIAIADDIR